MKIDLIAQDLVNKVKAVPSLGGRVGLAVGGTDIDPANRDLPRPFSWVVFVGIPITDAVEPASQMVAVSYTFVVKAVIDYSSEADLISTDLPVLEEIITSVKGSSVTGLGFHEWAFSGMTLESLDPDRMVWVLNFSVNTSL